MQTFFYTCCLLFLLQNTALSQEIPTKNRLTRIDAGYAGGVSGDSYFYVANQGLVLSVAHGKQWESATLLGGVGYEAYDDVHFVPIFMEVSKSFGKLLNTELRLRLGYAAGFPAAEVENPEYNFSGGAFIQSGVGIPLVRGADFNLKLWVDYKYQHAQFKFQPFDGANSVQTRLYYHFASLKIGVEF